MSNKSHLIIAILSTALTSISFPTFAKDTPDWSKNVSLAPGENRQNIFQVTPEELDSLKNSGYIHAMKYPVSVTGLLIPYRPLTHVYQSDDTNPLKLFLLDLTSKQFSFSKEELLYQWLGLSKHNGPNATGIYKMPYPNGQPDQFYVGAGIVKRGSVDGLTFSCFACHSNNLFGKTVMGLTNKKPHANMLFQIGRMTVPFIPDDIYKIGTQSNSEEMALFRRTKQNILAVGGVAPQVHGLDTSLPHTALSLARRNLDDYATKNPYFEAHPRPNELSHFVADSKPMPWWNLKYKTRWLSDGSVVSGNPIFTNFLWNEIGRGTDLHELEQWMQANIPIIEELTAAVFATEAPRYTDFFPAESINLTLAQKGEKLFNETCSRCHGQYEKAWSKDDHLSLSPLEALATTKVIYHSKTPVINVGTDPQRAQAMKYFASNLNELAISKWMRTTIEPQEGYVPPPLVGIWSRYPYFHNGSIPNLCALLTPPDQRPKTFVMGPSINKETDFSQDCVGYPTGSKIPMEWRKNTDAYYDTRKPGLSNSGHYKMLLDETGKEKYSTADKKAIIEFLKTL